MRLKNEVKFLFFRILLLVIPFGVLGALYLSYTLIKSVYFYNYIKQGIRGWSGSIFRTDVHLGYAPIANARGSEILAPGPDIPACFDGNGFRVPSDNYLLSTEKGKILVLGCSFTYGAATPAEYTYPDVLERLTNMHVMNAGVPGYGLSQMMIQAKTLIPKYKPDWVIVQYSPWLIDRACSHFAPSNIGKIPSPFFYSKKGQLILHDPVYMPQIVTYSITPYRHTSKSVSEFFSFFFKLSFKACLYEDYNMGLYKIKYAFSKIPQPTKDKGLVIEEVYRNIQEIASNNGAKMMIVVLGRFDGPVFIPNSILPSNVPVIDAQKALIDVLPEKNKVFYQSLYGHWLGNPPKLIDNHPNATAHKKIANELAKALSFFEK